ncbi:exonuclease domain-containing protein [Patulibacter defluvii]|uniref:exonuclease domain-containing protein n=1 Tax=Patulibacter defluvii TaxID=3095358 RepID=UPI002A75B05D|nr:exonuclease domain-containing protein [Patulibacter sp. DM4]
MSWHAGRLAAFDLETTGIELEHDRIVTAAVSIVGGGLPSESHDWLVDPEIEIPAEATAVHGISTEHARTHGRDAREAIEEIVALLAAHVRDGVPIVAFNARFDLTILDREARRHELRPLVDRIGGAEALLVVDPLVIDKAADRYRPGKRTLTAVSEHYRVRLDSAHAADADAIAAARVAWRLGQRFPQLRDATLADLHRWQVVWADRQARSLEEYFRSQGRPEHVEPAWPIVPLPLPVAPLAVAA